MRKGLWKRGLALGLAAAITLGLAACGGGEKDENSQLAKENVYSFEDLGLIGTDENINDMIYLDGKLYLLVNNYRYDEEGNETHVFGYYKANVDGTDKSFVELTLPEREENYSWINNTLLSPEGYIYVVNNSSFEDYSDPENPIYEDRYFLNCWNIDGELLWSQRLDAKQQDEYSYCNQLLDVGDGKALAIMNGTRCEAVIYSPQGEEVSRKELDSDIFERTDMMYTRDDGTLMVVTYDENWTKRQLVSYDINTGTVGEQAELDFNGNYSMYKGVDSDLLLTNNLGVYTWSIGDAEPKMLMNNVNSDLPANNMYYIQMIDNKHFVAVYNDMNTWEQKCAYFTYVDPKDIPDKEVLVLGGAYVGSDVRMKGIEFNKASEQYRITIKDYSIYNTNEDWTAGQVRLNNDIISGQMPDIMQLDDMSNYSNYIAKGLLADVGKLLADDPELGKLEYLQNVQEAFSVSGKLYAVVPSFSVRTMVAKKSLVGEPQSWTMADAEAVLPSMAEGATIFGEMMRDNYIYYMLSYAGQDFIDMETGKCSFASQSFIDMLEYAKTLPNEYSEDYWEDYDYNYYEGQYRENRSLLYDLYINNIRDCKYQIKGYIGEEVSFVGFPTYDSNGSTLNYGNYSFMISARSGHQDGAWQFVRQFLTEEYQTSNQFYDMPVLKSAFLDKAKEATERPYWTDEDGNKEYYDDTWYINGEEIVLEPFTQEEVDAMCEFIYTVNRMAYYNDDIRNIITEEAEAFFSGQKSAQEVVDIIQSRAQVFVNENR
ncbi:MAG: extracellular solute-binding protein [Acetatifactor sp.]|nr:extracellular solute-binding protein [Acetatifactor sp.]